MMAAMRLAILLLLQLLISCTSSHVQRSDLAHKPPRPSPPFENLFKNPVVIEPVEKIFKLSDVQKQDFFSYYNSINNRSLTPVNRVVHFLREHLKTFKYHSDTLVATQTFAENRGNCLSLAILTRALAKISEVHISYQLVDTPPLYLRDGGIVLSSRHVRAILHHSRLNLSKSTFSFNKGSVIIDYFPSRGTRTLRTIDENEFFSMYYLNKAAEALVEANYELAYWLTRTALALKPDDGQAINTMAVIHERMGHFESAEKLYRYGLKYGQEKLLLLSNYHQFLNKQNRTDEAQLIAAKLKKYEQHNPFKYIDLANKLFSSKDYSSALHYYKKAAKVADYLDEAYAGIAKSQYMLGYKKRALRSLKKALQRSQRDKSTALYQAKYKLLKKQL